jgi:hypothetical protein
LEQSVKTGDDSSGQQMPKAAESKDLDHSAKTCFLPPQDSSAVPTDDRTNTPNVTHSDKLDNKPSSVLQGIDSNLATIIERWSDLTEPVKAGIVAMIKATIKKENNA